MGKIKQGILGGFKGKVGTVIGSSWNGIAYMKGRPQSQKDPKTEAQQKQRSLFTEVQGLVGQLSAVQLAFLFPNSPQGMTRRNALVQQLAAASVTVTDGKYVDLANLKTLGNAPTADLPAAAIIADSDNLSVSWDGASDWRNAHADEFPSVFVANVTKKKIFLLNSSVPFGSSGVQSFTVGLSVYGEASDTFSGFLLSTGAKTVQIGIGTMGVCERPARPPKKNN